MKIVSIRFRWPWAIYRTETSRFRVDEIDRAFKSKKLICTSNSRAFIRESYHARDRVSSIMNEARMYRANAGISTTYFSLVDRTYTTSELKRIPRAYLISLFQPSCVRSTAVLFADWHSRHVDRRNQPTPPFSDFRTFPITPAAAGAMKAHARQPWCFPIVEIQQRNLTKCCNIFR
jgi:hypothetical protein